MIAAGFALVLAWLGLVALAIGVMNWLHGLRINSKALNLVAGLVFLAVAAALGRGAWLLARQPMVQWPAAAWLPVIVGLGVTCCGLPWSSWKRHLRHQEARRLMEVTGESDLGFEYPRAALAGTSWRAPLVYLPGNEALTLRRARCRLAFPDLPADLCGLEILLVGDLHFSTAYRRRFFELVFGPEAERPADLVLFAGDLVDDARCLDWVVPLLGPLSGRQGKFAILGNHDYLCDAPGCERQLAAAGFTMIGGRWVPISRGASSLALGGTAAPWGPGVTGPPDTPADFTLLLSHSPDTLYQAARWGVDLVLAGHTHGGQVTLPILGPIVMPSRYSRRFDAGAFRCGSTRMYVTPGIGAEVPVRYGCRPEIVRFVLENASPGSSHPEGGRSWLGQSTTPAIDASSTPHAISTESGLSNLST
jgi:predicted MPP superfamily phosphohydrolase